jgi:DNA-binding transcriptional regulator PaaX
MEQPLFNHRVNRDTVLKATILALAVPIILSSPIGTRRATQQFSRELRKHLKRREEKKFSPENVRQALYRIKREGYYRQIQGRDGKIHFELTAQGEKLLHKYQFSELGPKAPSKWDGKWHLVSFDIPQRANYAREILRDKLKRMGFFRVQQSLWVHPYDCTKELDFIIDFLHIEGYVLEFRVKVERDERMKAYFQKQGIVL